MWTSSPKIFNFPIKLRKVPAKNAKTGFDVAVRDLVPLADLDLDLGNLVLLVPCDLLKHIWAAWEQADFKSELMR